MTEHTANRRRRLAIAVAAIAVAAPFVLMGPRGGVAATNAPAASATLVKLPQIHTVAIAGPGAQEAGFATRVVVASRTGILTFFNFDIVEHNFVQMGTGNPLFWTPLVGLGKSATVQGLLNLQAGRIYQFYCTIHPNMTGSLHVIA